MLLTIEKDQTIHQRINLQDGDYLIGREGHCDIQLDSPEVSRRHARLLIAGNKASIKDLGSSNGTYLSDNRIASGQIRASDTIGIGGYELILEVPLEQRSPAFNFDFDRLKSFRPQRIHVYSVLLIIMMLLVFGRQFSSVPKEAAAQAAVPVVASAADEVTKAREVTLDLTKGTHQQADTTIVETLPPQQLVTEVPPATTPKTLVAKKPKQVQRTSQKTTRKKTRSKAASSKRKKRTTPKPAPKQPVAVAPVIQLTLAQQEQAKILYYQAYRLMAYRTEKAYLKALTLFQEVQKVAPDSTYEFNRKAALKIGEIKRRL